MLYEDLRYVHEDVERLEGAIADRVQEDPKLIRNRLTRDHEIANFLSRIQTQSERALHIYNNEQESRTQEVQTISIGDPFEEFYKQLDGIKTFHKKYPNEPVENLERAYRTTAQGGPGFAGDMDAMFTGEEAFGRFFDLTLLHEEYLNLPGVKGTRKCTYLQYVDIFDAFTAPACPISVRDKKTDAYFSYVGSLAQYLESFMRRTKPLEDLAKSIASFEQEFEKLWEENQAPGWEGQASQTNGAAAEPATEGTGEGVWCADCQKEFKNDSVYKAHLTGKKHMRNAEMRQQQGSSGDGSTNSANGASAVPSAQRMQERAIAQREHMIRKLAGSMSTEREDTRVNVERRAGMTDRERQQELAALYAEDEAVDGTNQEEKVSDDEDEEKVYNPLKLPLAWDGKPIPFWLYKLHGLGVEFSCEICGNYVYMGRRAFEKHFSESRHIYGLKCLGITQTSLFREITKIEEAEKLWEKIQRDKKKTTTKGENVVQMEDGEGNVMPQRVYDDLLASGML